MLQQNHGSGYNMVTLRNCAKWFENCNSTYYNGRQTDTQK